MNKEIDIEEALKFSKQLSRIQILLIATKQELERRLGLRKNITELEKNKYRNFRNGELNLEKFNTVSIF